MEPWPDLVNDGIIWAFREKYRGEDTQQVRITSRLRKLTSLSILVPGPQGSVPASSFGREGYYYTNCHRQKAVFPPRIHQNFSGLLKLQWTLFKSNFKYTKHRGKTERPASSSLVPFSRVSAALMDVVYQYRALNTTCSQEINCLAVGCLYVVIGMFLHLKLPEGLYKYSAHKYNYSRALARNSHLLWDIAVSSPYQSHCKIQ